MKKRAILPSLLFGAIGAVAGFVAIDLVNFMVARNRSEKKETGIFRHDPPLAITVDPDEIEIEEVEDNEVLP